MDIVLYMADDRVVSNHFSVYVYFWRHQETRTDERAV